MNLNEDEILNIIKYMDIDDIHSLCETNKSLKEFCKQHKNIIYKNVIYAIEYIEYKDNIDTLSTAIIAVYSDKKDAIMRLNLLFTDKKAQLQLKHEMDRNFSFSWTEDGNKMKKLEEDNDDKNDWTYIWKIIPKRIF